MNTIIKSLVLSAFILLLAPGVSEADGGSKALVLIANKSVVETSISAMDVKLLFLGKMGRWSDGQKIKPATLRGGIAHERLLSKYIHKTPSTYTTYWRRAIVTGTGIPPKQFKTETELIEYVASTRGAIGYVTSKPGKNRVKVIKVRQ